MSPIRLRHFALATRLPAAVVFITDPDQLIPGEELLRQLHGLTAAEAGVAKLLLEGLKVDDVTSRLGVTTATARTHVRRILDKTEARGQSDLIRILMAPAAIRLEKPEA